MGIIKRVMVELSRKSFKTISLLLIFVFFCIVSMTGEMIIQSIEKYVDQITIREGLGIKIEGKNTIKLEENIMPIDKELTKQIMGLKHVTGYNTTIEYLEEFKPLNCQNVPYQKIDNLAIVKKAENITIVGNLNTDMWDGFRCGDLVLIEGEYPGVQNYGVVIDSKFAEINNLQIGKSIEIFDELSSQKTEVKITGIYQTFVPPVIENKTINGTYYVVSPSSYLFCDLYTFKKLSLSECSDKSLIFFVDSYDNINMVYDEIKKILSDNQAGDIIKSSEKRMSYTTELIFSMKNITTKFLVFIYIIGLMILTLMTVLWMRDHKYETGIYIALGLKKYKILLYYGMEIFLFVIVGGGVAAILAYFLINNQGKLIIKYILQVNGILEEQVTGGINAIYYFSEIPLIVTNIKWVLCMVLSTLISGIIIVNFKPRDLFQTNE